MIRCTWLCALLGLVVSLVACQGSVERRSGACDPGTQLLGGKCVAIGAPVAPGAVSACPSGTLDDAGACKPSGVVPAAIAAIAITHLRLESPLADPATGEAQLALDYPVDVQARLHVAWKSADEASVVSIPVAFALGEKGGKGFCVVGAVDGFTTGRALGPDNGEDVDVKGRFFVAAQCLANDRGVVDPSLRRTMNPIVMVDPNDDLGGGLGPELLYSPDRANDPAVKACDRDLATSNGDSCAQDLLVTGSPGLDLDLEDVALHSSVVALEGCASKDNDDPDGDGGAQPAPDDAGSGVSPGACGTALVQDSKGNWVQGAPDLHVNETAWIYGVPDRDDAGPVNAIAGNPERFTYQFRPASSADDADWEPLYLHAREDDLPDGGLPAARQIPWAEETSQVAMTPKLVHHGLYFEDDCAGPNDTGCNPAVHPRTDVMTGKWKDETRFVLRACVSSDAEAAGASRDDDCRKVAFRIVRVAPPATARASANGKQAFDTTKTSKKLEYSKSWDETQGDSSRVALTESFSTDSSLDTSGAHTTNSGDVALSSGLFSSFDIVKAWADGDALVAITGSDYDYGLEVLGDKVFGDSESVPSFSYSTTPLKWAKEYDATFTYYIVQVTFGASGELGMTFGFDMEAETGAGLGYDAATKVGEVVVTLTPYAQFDATASASISGGVVQAGVSGSLTLIDMSVPITASATWGLTSLTSLEVTGQAEVDLDLSTMSGTITVFAQDWVVDWCSKKIGLIKISYPCGSGWNTFWSWTLADWSGWSWNTTLWKQQTVSETLKL